MDSYEKVISKIDTYIAKTYNDRKNITYHTERLNSLTNQIFHVTITENEKILEEIIYRNFGEFGSIVDREFEESVIKALSDKGEGPKIKDTDHTTYRIDEYVTNAKHLKQNELIKEDNINKIIKALVSYEEIAPIYQYSVKHNKINIKILKSDILFKVNTFNNYYDVLMNKMLPKGIDRLNQFDSRIRQHQELMHNEHINSQWKQINTFANSISSIITSIYPKQGYYILNHNDIFRLNFLINKEQFDLIDHEYGGLNLIGYDIVNYLIETSYDYSPKYIYDSSNVNIDKYYQVYLQYIEHFSHSNIFSFFNQSKEGKEYINSIRQREYFINLFKLNSIFWFVVALVYLDFDSYINDKTTDYLAITYNRYDYFKIIDKL